MLAVPPGDRIRVAVTGVGMVTPCGADRRTSWQGLLAGKGMTRWLRPDELQSCTPFPEHARRLAGAPACRTHLEECQPRLDPVLEFALSAAREALADSRISLEDIDRSRIGCVIGASKGGLRTFARAFRRQHHPGQAVPQRDVRHREACDWEQVFPHAASAWISRTWDLCGPALCPVAACATGLVSAQRAAQLIADGTCDAVLAGSSDASLQEILLASYGRLGVLARGFEDPAAACRPFDRRRSGFLVGEGAGMLLFERLEHAQARGATLYAEWLAGGLTADLSTVGHSEPEPASLVRLIQDVIRRAGLEPRELDYINLHGTGTRENDPWESRAIEIALAPSAARVACSSLKGTLGHLLGAAGSVELAATVLALHEGRIPPTANLHEPDIECRLDYTPLHARAARIQTALKLSQGFGGHLAAGLLRRF